jgi:hypothetical protein
MDNPFTSAYAPKTMADQQYQPMMQDIRGQQAFQNQLSQQQSQLLQPPQQQQSNPMALAQALMKYKANPTEATDPNAPTNLEKLQGWWSSVTAPTPYDIQGL